MVTLHHPKRGWVLWLRKLGKWASGSKLLPRGGLTKPLGEGVAHSSTYLPTTRGRPEGAASRNFLNSSSPLLNPFLCAILVFPAKLAFLILHS